MGKNTDKLRQRALTVFNQAIAAADPYNSVKKAIHVAENHIDLFLDSEHPNKKRSGRWNQIHVIAAGKAANKMVQAAIDVIPEHRMAGKPLIVSHDEQAKPDNVNYIQASHPVPDENSVIAARQVVDHFKRAQQGELILFLLSGGGSSLLCYPVEPLNLIEKQQVNRLLLASGATINQVNCVRKHLSQIKGGRLAEFSVPADLHSLIMSDVVGDDLSSIASGPTVADDSCFSDALEILKEKRIWDEISEKVKDFLLQGCQGLVKETPYSRNPVFSKTSYALVGSNRISLEKAVNAVKKQGFNVVVYDPELTGEAKQQAEKILLFAKQKLTKNGEKLAILSGGETTVTLTGSGKGGRNQEMALAFSIAANKMGFDADWVFLSGGTDGRDGPTDAAGGLVDSGTYQRLKKARVNPENRLKNNDSYSALKRSDDLVLTGATGTNVADIQILLIQ